MNRLYIKNYTACAEKAKSDVKTEELQRPMLRTMDKKRIYHWAFKYFAIYVNLLRVQSQIQIFIKSRNYKSGFFQTYAMENMLV